MKKCSDLPHVLREASIAALLVLAGCVEPATQRASEELDTLDVKSDASDGAQRAPDLNHEWARAKTPVLMLGAANGASELLFNRIRAVRLLSDGALLVADGSSQELRVFSRNGALEARFGGSGSGPGEFLYLQSAVVVPGDTVVVYDSRSHRLSEFSRTGRLIADHRLPGAAAIGDELVGRLSQSGYLLAKPSSPAEPVAGVQRGVIFFVVVRPGEATSDTISTLPGLELQVVRNESGSWTTYEIPFARTAFFAVSPRQTWVAGTNDAFEITRYDLAGNVLHSFALPEAEVVLSSERIASIEARTIERLSPTGRRLASIRSLFANVPPPNREPAFARLVVDDLDRLWVGNWFSTFSGPDGNTRPWRVFDPSGAYLGTVVLPAGFEAQDVRGNRIAGVEFDAIGVERVVVFEFLAKP